MLSPRYLDGLSDEITEIYSQLETDILQDMARRIARLGRITDMTKWQAQMLAEAGGLKKNIARILAKYDRAIVRQITDIFTEALETNARNDNRIFKEATGRTVSAPNAQAMLSTIQKCHSDLSRLTLTTAATTQTQFVQQANRVYMMTQSGAVDYDTAMKSAADELAKRGITTVQYENGKPVTRTIESAVRMNILTSINQTAANQTLSNAEELGVEKFEVTAHIGSRPEHEAWQGKIYTKQELYSVCGLGDVAGLCGINCRHSFYPYFEGMEKHYTQDDLDEMADKKVAFNGQEMTRYEGEQKLRGIERRIRAYKRQALTQEAAGADSTKARRKLGEWQAAARDFTKQTGIERDRAREHIGTAGNQPRGIIPPKPATPGATPTPAPTTDTATVRAVASYRNGGSIAAEYAKKTAEERENVDALRPLAMQGKKVMLIGRSKETGVRTADAIIDGEKWEVKTNYNPTKSAIDNALRSCKGQAKNLIINIQSDITDATLIDGIKMRLHRTDIEKIVVVRNGKIERTIRRQEILEYDSGKSLAKRIGERQKILSKRLDEVEKIIASGGALSDSNIRGIYVMIKEIPKIKALKTVSDGDELTILAAEKLLPRYEKLLESVPKKKLKKIKAELGF